ncbi:hypothetical protein C8J57DRAFT_1310492 [Mycena rebaudengoi]|nr:hypothetical protein C8J57DRAFT_1310492 [Mycena rebaudengoi]
MSNEVFNLNDPNLRTTTRYIIPAISPEKDRLSKQYAMKKGFYGWSKAVPDMIDVSEVEYVMDIAAGTCIWSLDFASMPQILARREAVRLYACDINTAFFPDSKVMEDMGITTFEQDVTNPFPEEYYGKFDLIHTSFLVICLTEDGWEAALANIAKLLKPGGIAMMDESDPIFFIDKQFPPPIDAAGYDLNKYMDGNTWVNKANCVYTGFALQNGFIVGLTFCLRAMLERAGLKVEHSERGIATFGKACLSQKALDGSSLAEYEDFSLENMKFILAHLAGGMFRKGTLEVPQGNAITEEEKMEAILREINSGLKDEGAIAVGAYFVARKKN